MGIDYSGNYHWQTQEAVWSGVWGGFYLDAKAQLLIILALPGPLGCLRHSETNSTAQDMCRPTIPSSSGSDQRYRTGWGWALLRALLRLRQGPGPSGLGSPSAGGVGGGGSNLFHTGEYIPENFLKSFVSMLHFLTTHMPFQVFSLSNTHARAHTHTQILHIPRRPGHLLLLTISITWSGRPVISSKSWFSHQCVTFHTPFLRLSVPSWVLKRLDASKETGCIGRPLYVSDPLGLTHLLPQSPLHLFRNQLCLTPWAHLA